MSMLGSQVQLYEPRVLHFHLLGYTRERRHAVTRRKKWIEKNCAAIFIEKREVTGDKSYAEFHVSVLSPPPPFLWHCYSRREKK